MAIQVPIPDLKAIVEKSGMSEVDVRAFIETVERSMQPEKRLIPVLEDGERHYLSIERRGIGPLITPLGTFWEFSFTINDRWQRYSVIVKGEIDYQTLTPVFKDSTRLVLRTDSGCETGQLFQDQTCDCKEQLHLAMQTIEQAGEGMIVNIPHQDGRGMGLTFKLATLWLQQQLGVDTVESAGLLAPDGIIDVRTYSGVVAVLKFFGIPESCVVNLETNNPHKVRVFVDNGYSVDTIPIVIKPTEHTAHHLAAKQAHLDHVGLVRDPQEND